MKTKNIKTTTTKKIKTLMEKKGVSNKRLSSAIGIPEPTLCRYLNGSRKISIEALSAIADYFNVSVDFLLGKPTYRYDDDNFGCILNSAVRYSLGRMTYMPSTVAKFIIPLLPKLNNRTVWCFIKDVEDYQKDVEKGITTWGMDCDKDLWLEFLAKCKSEMDRR